MLPSWKKDSSRSSEKDSEFLVSVNFILKTKGRLLPPQAVRPRHLQLGLLQQFSNSFFFFFFQFSNSYQQSSPSKTPCILGKLFSIKSGNAIDMAFNNPLIISNGPHFPRGKIIFQTSSPIPYPLPSPRFQVSGHPVLSVYSSQLLLGWSDSMHLPGFSFFSGKLL